jgi:predicted nucleotidyltransferase component of viral defense system
MNRDRAKQISRTIRRIERGVTRLSVNELRVIVALERAIARLERHKELAEHLVFKGGFVMLKIYDSERFTRDGDALAVGIDKEELKTLISQALEEDLDDGMWFGDVHVDDLEEQGQYGSYRFDFAFQIGEPDLKKVHKLSRIHIDVGFSDKLPARPADSTMPSLLEYESPVSWKVYPIEYIFAEKLETLYDRGSASSRAKDIYDLVYLIPLCKDEEKLIEAIRQTFRNRSTELPPSLVKRAQEFDRVMLIAAWPGVQVMDEKVEFDETWEALLKHLTKLDGLLHD